MARIETYEVTYSDGTRRLKRLNREDADRLGNRQGVRVKKQTPTQNKKRQASEDKSA